MHIGNATSSSFFAGLPAVLTFCVYIPVMKHVTANDPRYIQTLRVHHSVLYKRRFHSFISRFRRLDPKGGNNNVFPMRHGKYIIVASLNIGFRVKYVEHELIVL